MVIHGDGVVDRFHWKGKEEMKMKMGGLKVGTL